MDSRNEFLASTPRFQEPARPGNRRHPFGADRVRMARTFGTSRRLTSGWKPDETARGSHSHGTRDEQERPVHWRQGEPPGVLAPLGGLGGSVPPVRHPFRVAGETAPRASSGACSGAATTWRRLSTAGPPPPGPAASPLRTWSGPRRRPPPHAPSSGRPGFGPGPRPRGRRKSTCTSGPHWHVSPVVIPGSRTTCRERTPCRALTGLPDSSQRPSRQG